MDKKEFFNLCKQHDWYYAYSDDSRVYWSGSSEINKLTCLARTYPDLMPILKSFQNHMFSGKSWGTERAPNPTYEMFGIEED